MVREEGKEGLQAAHGTLSSLGWPGSAVEAPLAGCAARVPRRERARERDRLYLTLPGI